MELVELVSRWLGIEKLYFTKIEGCCPTSIPLSEVVFTYRWFTDEDEQHIGVDFWELFGKGKEVLEHKLEELKQGKKVEEPEDIKVALETFDYIMDASKRLSEKDIEAVTDNLSDYRREIDSNVVIAREFISPLLGPKGIIVLNSRHASSSELHAKEPSKLRVASAAGTWRGLGIGHPCAWHGEVDMMVVPNDAIPSEVTAVLVQPVTDNVQDEDMSDSAGCTLIEGKQDSSDMGLGFSQAIATAITSSFAYKPQYGYEGTLFPTIQVSRSGFEIFLYDSETDVLLMNTFQWLPTTIVYLWAVLHYHLLLTTTTKSSDNFKCSYRRLSDEFGGLTRFEGRTKFAVPIANISHKQKRITDVLFRSEGGKRKHVP